MRKVRVRVNDEWYDVRVGDIYQSPVDVEIDGEIYMVELDAAVSSGSRKSESNRTTRKRNEHAGLRGLIDEKVIRCPLPGRVVAVSVVKDQTLQPGDEICVLESMKMENPIIAHKSGVIKSISVSNGFSVKSGDTLLVLE